MGNKPINGDILKLLLVGNEHRGNDATGIAISQADGRVDVFKDDDPAWRFVTMNGYKKFIDQNLQEDSWAVLLHTRAATQGSPRQNKNNHPMHMGAGAIVHNGVISNDDSLFTMTGLDRSAETDSDIIRAFVDRYGITEECVTNLNRLCGSAAGSAIHPEFPKKLLLFRSGSPMTLGSNDDFLVWSSEKATIHRALRPWVERFGMWFQEQKPEIAFSPFPDDSAWVIGENGLEFHGKFKTLQYQYTEPFRRTYEGYKDRQTKWDDQKRQEDIKLLAENNVYNRVTNRKPVSHPKEKFDDAVCPKCHMNWFIVKGGDPKKFICDKDKKGCGSELVSSLAVVGAN